jgi:hypothetical protein
LPFLLNLTGEYDDYTKPNQNRINPRRRGGGSGGLQFFLDFSRVFRDNGIWQEININNLRGHLCTVEEIF